MEVADCACSFLGWLAGRVSLATSSVITLMWSVGEYDRNSCSFEVLLY